MNATKLPIKSINLYISKNFLLRFFQITFGFYLLIFFINLIDTLEKVRDSGAPFYAAFYMALLQAPIFLNDISPSLVLISSIATFFLLSSRSELTIMRMSGFSLWHILRPLGVSAILLGIFWIAVFGPISIWMINEFNHLESKYVHKEMREEVAPKSGIWLKQENLETPSEELIIRVGKVFKKDLEFGKITIWFFDKNGNFYKKIDAEKAVLNEGYFLLKDATLNSSESINKTFQSLQIATNLESDFVMQKVVNNFQNVNLFSVFELPHLIRDLKSAGFNPLKFQVYFHSLLSKPLLFLAMTFIACYFGLNHVRNQHNILMVFIGIVFGLVLYITSSIVTTLGSSALIPTFAATWVIAIIFLAIGILLIYNKEAI